MAVADGVWDPVGVAVTDGVGDGVGTAVGVGVGDGVGESDTQAESVVALHVVPYVEQARQAVHAGARQKAPFFSSPGWFFLYRLK